MSTVKEMNDMEKISLPGELESIAPITDYVLDAAAQAGLDKKATYRVRLAVEEVVANIIQHGYKEANLTGAIDVHAKLTPSQLIITLEDCGRQYDPRKQLTPDTLNQPVEERDLGGLGVFLTMENVDDYLYEYTNGCNRNTLIFRRPQEPSVMDSKTQQVNRITSGFISALANSHSSSKKLDAVIHRVLDALEKNGIQLSVDISPYVDNLKEHLQHTRDKSSRMVEQLKQFQKLLDVSAMISSSLELDEVLNNVMDTIINLTHAERAYLMLQDKKTEELTARAARNWDRESMTQDEVVFSQSIVNRVIGNGSPVISTDVQHDERFNAMQSIFIQQLRSVMCIPLKNRGQVIGVLYADNSLEEAQFDEDFIPILTIFANQAATAIENARLFETSRREAKLERELQIGQQIQAGFLPKELPKVDGWEIAAYFHPARQVAGDYYDVFSMARDKIAFVVGDVCDKGLGAALFMALFRSLLRAFAQQHHALGWMDGLLGERKDRSTTTEDRRMMLSSGASNLKDAIQLTNDYIAENHGDSNMFATMFFGMFDPKTGMLTYINAGHNPPFLISKDNTLKQKLGVTGPAVGLMPDMDFDIERCQIESGDCLLCFTDGVTEAQNMEGAFYTEDRLLNLTQQSSSASADDLVEEVRKAVHTFIGDADQFDDITMLAVRRQETP